ncbi:hypothetical protein D3C76_1420240 [compost metagenome]
MGIDLALQHPVFQLLLLFLVSEPAVHKRYDILGQAVNAPADIAKLAVPFDIAVQQEIALGDLINPLLQFFHRKTDGTGQIQRNDSA